MNIQEEEERDFVVATDQDWDRADASALGAASPDREWICTDRDVWYRNPFYVGEPGRHPEDDHYEDDEPYNPQDAAEVELDDCPF